MGAKLRTTLWSSGPYIRSRFARWGEPGRMLLLFQKQAKGIGKRKVCGHVRFEWLRWWFNMQFTGRRMQQRERCRFCSRAYNDDQVPSIMDGTIPYERDSDEDSIEHFKCCRLLTEVA